MPNTRKVLDKAIKAIKAKDAFTVEEEDGVEIRYEHGTYVLYVDGKAMGDGGLEKVKRMMKEELKYR